VKLIVGLGNPGKEYEKTRHNIGFMMIDNYISSNNIVDKWSSKFNGKYIKDKINGEDTIFLKPQSYMNLSGGVVKKYVDYFKIPLENIIVISDDMDLFVGNFKIKDKGSCGGHNGLRDIEKNLGTSVYKRIKIGIAKDKSIDTKDYGCHTDMRKLFGPPTFFATAAACLMWTMKRPLKGRKKQRKTTRNCLIMMKKNKLNS